MRRILFAVTLLVGFGGPALADFADGQRRFSTGDHAGAYAAWLPLAEAGDAKAQYSLGVMHQQGLGRPKDPEGAAAWFERAARQGYAPATAALKAMGKPVAAEPLTERDRVEQALRAMLAQPGGAADYDAIRIIETASGFEFEIEQPRTSGPGPSFRFASVGGRASRAAEDALRFEFDVPKVIEAHDREGRPVRVRADQTRTLLVWNETLEMATEVDMDWRRIVVEAADGAPPAHMARILVRSSLQRADGERWSGPTEVRVEGIEMNEPGKAGFKLGAVVLRADLGGANLGRMLRLSRGHSGNPLGELRNLLSDASLELALEGLEVRHPKGRFSLAEGRWRLGLSKLDEPAFDLEIGYRHDGFADTQTTPLAGLMARDAELKLALTRAPMEALLQTGIAAGLEYMLLGQLNSGPALLETLRKALPAAGTQLRIESGLLRAAKAQVTATGAFAADAAAPFGAVGALGVSVVGMEEILKAAAQPDAAPAHKMLAALARRGERAGDGKALLYRFELGRDGRALVNGRPLVELLAE